MYLKYLFDLAEPNAFIPVYSHEFRVLPDYHLADTKNGSWKRHRTKRLSNAVFLLLMYTPEMLRGVLFPQV